MTDIIVVGGGTAGMTAAIYASRAGKKVLLIEKDSLGGQINFSPLVENYPGIPQMSGVEFTDRLLMQAEAHGVEFEYGEVTDIRRDGGKLIVDIPDLSEELSAEAVILALGASHRQLGLEKEEDLIGSGVSYCAVCDGAFYEGMDVAVNGGGNTALQDALFLSSVCSHVTVIHRRDEFRGDARLVRQLEEKENVSFRMSSTVTGLVEEAGELFAVTVKDLKTGEEKPLEVKGLFIAIGQIPQTMAFRNLIKTDEQGYLKAGEICKSSMPGVFVAGDCRTKEVRQLTTAAADGAVAALEACHYIDEKK